MRVGRGDALVIFSGVGVASVKEAFLSCGSESDHCLWGTFKDGFFEFSAAEADAAVRCHVCLGGGASCYEALVCCLAGGANGYSKRMWYW
jgi:hypothetical protein